MPTASGIPYQTVEIGRAIDPRPRTTTRPPARLTLRRIWTTTAITAALITVAVSVIELGRLDGGWHAYPPDLRALSLTLLGMLWMTALIVWATDRICAHIDRAEYRQTATTTAQVASLERDEQQISDQVQQLTTSIVDTVAWAHQIHAQLAAVQETVEGMNTAAGVISMATGRTLHTVPDVPTPRHPSSVPQGTSNPERA